MANVSRQPQTSESRLPPKAARARLIRQAIAENLRREREGGGFTQDGLGTACELARGTIRRIEKAEGEPRITTLDSIADVLQVPLDKLLIGLLGPSNH